MIYLQFNDMKTAVDEDTINRLTDQNYEILEDIEKGILDMIQSYIGGVYNLDIEFLRTNSQRNFFLLDIAKSLFSYRFYTVYSNEFIPEHVKYNYEKGLTTLKQLQTKDIPDLYNVPKRTEETDYKSNSYSVFTSNPKINSIY